MIPSVDPSLRPALDRYLALLDRWNKVHALTALPIASRWEELVLDAAALLPDLGFLSPGSRVGDFGTGMGMPAVLLALTFPHLKILALDKSRKKLAFVQQASLELGLRNLEVRHGRFEDLPPLGLDAGVAKALAPLDALAGWWERHGGLQAPFFALKGPEATAEAMPPGWCLAWRSYTLPTRGQRTVVTLKKGA